MEDNITLEQLIESAFDFSIYPEQEKQNMIDETTGLVAEAALLRSVDEASPEVKEIFNSFIQGQPEEDALMVFIQEHFPRYQDHIIEEIKHLQALELSDEEMQQLEDMEEESA
jgi:hypothetical protein